MSEKFTFVINTYKKLIQKIYFSVFLVTSDGNDERYQDFILINIFNRRLFGSDIVYDLLLCII